MTPIQYNHKKYIPTGRILQGPKAGNLRYYFDALYNSLVCLKPKLCLEIGTHYGDSAKVFQAYFDEFMPEGRLITCDIKTYCDLSSLKNVIPVIVHPHANNMDKHHNVNPDLLLPVTESTLTSNREIILAATETNDKSPFDFAFVDGDHQVVSAVRDIEIACSLLKTDCPFLLDDVDEEYHELSYFYHNNIKKSGEYDIYDFSDWPVTTGVALLKEKN